MMKTIIRCFITMLCCPVLAMGQTTDIVRKSEIERYMTQIYTVAEFRQITDLLQLSIGELCDYPVISPVKSPVVSSGFGWRLHPIHNVRKFHTGIDFVKAKGTPIYATGNGVIIRKDYDSGYGNYIEIAHAGGFRSFYAHLSKGLVSVGDSVNITQQIACVGNTGTTTGYHLHYEIRKEKRFLNPAEWCYLLYKMKISA